MGDVITIKSPEKWAEITLAKRQLRWTKEQQKKSSFLDFDEAIEKEESIIRSFMEDIRDHLAA
jgi:tRNA A37 N6-isopentenylltransferase MiaA